MGSRKPLTQTKNTPLEQSTSHQKASTMGLRATFSTRTGGKYPSGTVTSIAYTDRDCSDDIYRLVPEWRKGSRILDIFRRVGDDRTKATAVCAFVKDNPVNVTVL